MGYNFGTEDEEGAVHERETQERMKKLYEIPILTNILQEAEWHERTLLEGQAPLCGRLIQSQDHGVGPE